MIKILFLFFILFTTAILSIITIFSALIVLAGGFFLPVLISLVVAVETLISCIGALIFVGYKLIKYKYLSLNYVKGVYVFAIVSLLIFLLSKPLIIWIYTKTNWIN